MRKALVLFIVLLVLISGCFFTAHALVNSQKEQVTWDEEILYGDRSAVTGLRVTTRNSFDRSLLWTTTGVLGGDPDPETDFSFSNQNHYDYSPATCRGIDMFVSYTMYGFEDTSWMSDDTREQTAKLQQVYDECWEATPEGTERTYTIEVSDYLDYYLLDGWFDLPGYATGEWCYTGQDPALTEAGRILNEFFRIPILGKYTLTLTIDKNYSNGSTSSGIENDYTPSFSAAVTDSACYFTFSTVASEGVYADCSLIPGGYGIYSFSYSVENDPVVDMSSLSMVYPLDPTEMFLDLSVSADQRQLLLQSRDADCLYLTVIDIATMTCLQKFELAAANDAYYYWPRIEEDFIAVLRYNHEPETEPLLIFYERQADGTFRHVFTAPLNTDGFDMWQEMEYGGFDECELAYNGEHLVIGLNACRQDAWEEYYSAKTCDFYIAAYGTEGMAYAGLYRVSLTDVNNINLAFPCSPFGNYPLQLSWE